MRDVYLWRLLKGVYSLVVGKKVHSGENLLLATRVKASGSASETAVPPRSLIAEYKVVEMSFKNAKYECSKKYNILGGYFAGWQGTGGRESHQVPLSLSKREQGRHQRVYCPRCRQFSSGVSGPTPNDRVRFHGQLLPPGCDIRLERLFFDPYRSVICLKPSGRVFLYEATIGNVADPRCPSASEVRHWPRAVAPEDPDFWNQSRPSQ